MSEKNSHCQEHSGCVAEIDNLKITTGKLDKKVDALFWKMFLGNASLFVVFTIVIKI